MVFTLFCTNGKRYTSDLGNCRELLVIDVDSKTIADKISIDKNDKTTILYIIEDLVEKYDPYVLFICGISEEELLYIEESGIKVYVTKCVQINKLLEDIYGFRV
ncbi:MAG: hypothetical protein ABWW65_01725 [Thermoprotei archaeon]